MGNGMRLDRSDTSAERGGEFEILGPHDAMPIESAAGNLLRVCCEVTSMGRYPTLQLRFLPS